MASQLPQDFLDTFHDFAIDENQDPIDAFFRLADQRKWKVNGKTAYFGVPYQREEEDGSSVTNLATWQGLCEDASIYPVPISITKCKKALSSRTLLINLRDMVNYRRARELYDQREAAGQLSAHERRPHPPQLFNNTKELRKYTRKKGKTLSPKAAKENGLSILLRKLF
ncbi:hypothetical protein EV356DRAFT_532003 [Viridothelium virens]|uniref:Uncharacterized protein n=1 Tax=Viridothelium virens TaxID=1048519 RepID=A0A6A6HBQ0_VIRVR|nr:hypothetical protein EV356DRAFT_532003 [Viridothelium virens]